LLQNYAQSLELLLILCLHADCTKKVTETKQTEHTIITSANALEGLCKQIDTAGHFALDLEFIPERTYIPQLCLVQICVGNTSYIVDPLSVSDLSQLWNKVSDPKISVGLHAGEQDLAIIYHLSGCAPANVLDTQIAAGFLGFGYPIGYSKLLQQLLGVSISKIETFTDWMQRPLTDSQIEYAIDDVRYLPAMEQKLREMLIASNRLDWVMDECTSRYKSPRLFHADPERDFIKIKGSRALSRRGLAVLRELFRFRETQAVATNRPPQKIISDMFLLELARRPIKQMKDLERVRGLRQDQISKYGESIVNAVVAGLAVSEADLPTPSNFKVPSRSEVLKTDVLLLLLKSFCHASDLAPDLVATRADLEKLVRSFSIGKLSSDSLSLIQGWRNDLVGHKLVEALNGAPIKLQLTSDEAAVVLELEERN
jgi:ribonuclease D